MKMDNVLKLNSNLIIDRIDEEVFVFNEETQSTHILNEIAGFLLQHADGLTMPQLIDKLYAGLSDDEQNKHSKNESL